jgi:hypothetical protein
MDHVAEISKAVKTTIKGARLLRRVCRVGLHRIEWSDILRLGRTRRGDYWSFQVGRCQCCGRIKQRWVGPAEEFKASSGIGNVAVPTGNTVFGSQPFGFMS